MTQAPGGDLTPAQLAQARQHGYTLLSHLALHGVTPEVRPYLAVIEPLQAALPQSYTPDDAAAAHHSLWGYDLLPYASVFLDPAGQLEGPVTDAVQALYAKMGFRPAPPADHLGQELAYLAHLCGAEAAASHPAEALAWRTGQLDFLRSALLTWLPPLTVALLQQPDPFYIAMGAFMWEWVAAHPGEDQALPTPSSGHLPPEPAWEDSQTSLGDIATWLTTPPYAGFYLGRQLTGRLAQAHNLPCGFGGRQTMLLNLLYSAGRYDAILPLWEALGQLAQTHLDAYARLTTLAPLLTPWVAPWSDRTQATLAQLRRLHAQVTALDT